MAGGNFTATVDARINEFMARMQQVRNMILTAANDVTVDVNANINDFMANIQQVQNTASAVSDNVTVEVDADTSDFTADIHQVNSSIAAVDNDVSVDINANITAFMAHMQQVQNATAAIDNNVTVDVDADISGFLRRMREIRARIAALIRERVVIKIEARIEAFQNKINRIATNIRAFGELAQHTFSGLTTSLLPAVVPLISNIGVAIANLGPMLGTVAGSTFALVGAFATAGSGAVAFGAVAIPTIKALFDESAKLTAQQAAAKASFDAFKATYDGLVKVTEKPVLSAFQSAMTAANTILTQLKPLFVSSTEAVARLMEQLNQNIGTPPVQEFLEYLNSSGGKILETFGQAFGNVFKGLMSMLTAFAPLSQSTGQGFLEMTQRFAEWAAGLSASSKFQAFCDYVSTNMPKIRAIFRDAFVGIINLFAAFGDSSSGMMTALVDMMARFREWSATLSENQGFQTFMGYVQQTTPTVISLIGNLTDFLVNLGIGMAPLGAVILNIVNSFLEFANSAMESNRVIGILIAAFVSIGGILLAVVPNIIAFSTLFSGVGTAIMGVASKIIGFLPNLTSLGTTITNLATRALPMFSTAIGFITSPVGLVITAITSLVAILVGLYNTNETFRSQVQAVWSAIQTAISTAVNAVKSLITSVWGQITSFWNENQESIRSAASTVWNAIGTIVTTAMNVIGAIMQFIWPVVKALIVSTWNAIKNVVQGAVDVILGIIRTFSAILNGDWSSAWEGIKQILSGALQAAWGLINLYFVSKLLAPLRSFGTTATSLMTTVWTTIKGIFTSTLNTLKTLVTTIWTSIKTNTTTVWNGIKSMLTTVLNGIKSTMTTVWNAIKSTLTTVLNGIKSTATTIWSGIKSMITSVLNGIKSFITATWNAIKSTITTVLNAIKATATSVWNAIKSTITAVLNGIKSTVMTIWNGIKTTISNILDGIRSVISAAWEAIKSAVTSAMNGVKSAVQNGWESVMSYLRGIDLSSIGRNLIQGLINGIGSMAGALLDKARSIADSIKSTIQSALDIHSPSRWADKFIGRNFVKGIINGLGTMSSELEKETGNLAEVMQGEFNVAELVGASGGEISSIRHDMNRKIEVNVKVDKDDAAAVAGGVYQEVHLHSPKHLSPAENARKLKRVAQDLALKN